MNAPPKTLAHAKARASPIRLAILARLATGGEHSPNSLSRELEHSLSLLSYHMGVLRELGVVELCNEVPRRGAIEHFYRLADRAVLADEHQPERGDDIDAWLRRRRDLWPEGGEGWRAINGLLDRYRECSDYGLTLRAEDDERGDP